MASQNFSKLTEYLARYFGTGTFKAMLVTAVPSEAELDSWAVRSDVTSEHAANGTYATGGFSVTAAVGAVDTASNRVPVTFTAANPTYSNGTITGAVGAVIYKVVGSAATDEIVTFVDFGGTKSVAGGDFVVSFSTPLYINR